MNSPVSSFGQTHSSLAVSLRLSLQVPCVSDLMTPDPVTLSEEDTLKTLDRLFRWKSFRHVPIVNKDNCLVGLVTHRDFLTVAVSKLAHLRDNELDSLYDAVLIRDVMGHKVTTVRPDTPLREAAETMFKFKFGCLPVVTDDNKLVGIITESDFVKAFVDWSVRFGNTPMFG